MGVFYIIFENLLNAQLVIEQISKLQQDIQRKLLRMRKDARLIIFIDDIDRLTPEESIDLLKRVALNPEIWGNLGQVFSEKDISEAKDILNQIFPK